MSIFAQAGRNIVTPSTITIEIPQAQQLMKMKALKWHGYKVVRWNNNNGVVTIVATKAMEAVAQKDFKVHPQKEATK